MHRITAILLSLLLTSLTAVGLQAETVRLFEVDFPVDDLRPVDDVSIKVTIFGDEALVAKAQLPEFVAGKYLVRQNVNKLDRADVIRFASNAAKADSGSFAALAWIALLEATSTLSPTDLKAIQDLEQTAVFPDIVKLIISRTNQLSRHSQLIGWLLCAATETDFEWLRGRIVSFVYINEQSFKAACRERYLDYWSKADQARASQLLESFRELFGDGDGWYLELQAQHQAIVPAVAALNDPANADLSALAQVVQKFPELSQFLSALIVKQAHQKAAQIITEKNPLLALTLLSWLDQSWRTPTTHDLVLQALRNLPVTQAEQVLSGRTADFLYFVSIKDYTVKAVYLAYLQLALLKKLDQRDLSNLDQFFSTIKKLRPDPDAANDELRVNAAAVYGSLGQGAAAREQVQQMHRALNWIELIRLLFSGAFISPWALWSMIIGLITISGLVVYRWPTRTIQKPEQRKPRTERTSSERTARPIFAGSGLRPTIDPRRIEYEKLIGGFGLQGDASLAEIKSAYRKAVKMLHPDTNPNLSEAEQEKFRRITQDHARLLELRNELGL